MFQIGFTIDSVVSMQQFEVNKMKEKFIRSTQNDIGPVRLVIIDEISMVGANKLGTIDQLFRLATLRESDIMGGVHFLLAGDLYQLPPVIEGYNKSVYTQPVLNDSDLTIIGYNVYQSTTCFMELTKNFRFKTQELTSLNQRIRTGRFEIGDETYFDIQKSTSSNQINNLPAETLFITSTRQVMDAVNRESLSKLTTDNNSVVHLWAQHRLSSRRNKSTNKILDEVNYVTAEDLDKSTVLDFETRKILLHEKDDERDIKLKAHLSI